MPPKPKKDQTKSTPTNKSANDKDTIKRLKILVDSLEKEKETWEKKLKGKDEEIERLKVVQGFCGEGDNVSTTPITNSRDLRSAPAANGTTGEGNIQDQSKEIKRLTEENKKLKEELKKVKKEDTSLGSQVSLSDIGFAVPTDDGSKQTNNNSRETRSAPAANGTTVEGNIQDQSKEIKRLTRENEELTEKFNNLTEENKKLKEQCDKLTEENKKLKEECNKLEKTESELKDKIEKLEETQKENTDRPSADDKKNSDLTQEIKDLENKLSQQEQESQEKLEEKDKENSELSKTINDLQTDIAQLQKANKSNSPKPAASRDVKDAEAKVKQLEEKNEKLMEEKSKAVKEVDNMKNRLNSPKSAASRDLKDAEAKVKQLEEKNEKLMEEKNKAVREVDNLKNRLSQIAGSKLTDNNPGIADLSDPNRPLNLGEKFSELYDNQWTDAMEEMTDTVDEKQAIQILLTIVDDAYKFCVKISDGYCDQIENGITKLFKTELSSLQKKLTKDYRKSMAVYLVSDLEEEFCKRSYKFDGESVKSYQKQCIRVCWFMAVQDPKVFIDVEDVSGKKFEDDKYKHYTKTGKVTDYLVWPVLYLHKGGPMLGKGVAQGK